MTEYYYCVSFLNFLCSVFFGGLLFTAIWLVYEIHNIQQFYLFSTFIITAQKLLESFRWQFLNLQ